MQKNKGPMIVLVLMCVGGIIFSVSLFLGARDTYKHYINSKYHFSLLYPKNWKQIKTNDMPSSILVLENDQGERIYFSYFESLQTFPTNAPPERRSSLQELLQPDFTDVEAIAINSASGYKGSSPYKYMGYPSKDIYLEHDGHIYDIGYVESIETTPEVQGIIQSFTFLRNSNKPLKF